MSFMILFCPLIATNSFLLRWNTELFFYLTDKGEIAAGLGRSYSISRDGLTTNVTLAKNTFSDGTAITSSDIKASLARVAKVGGAYADVLSNVKGVGEAKGGADFFGITTPSKNSISFELITPDPFFVYHLAHPALGIVPSASIDTQGALIQGVNSGQYEADAITNIENGVTKYVPRKKTMPVINVVHKTLDDLHVVPNPVKVDMILGSTQSTDRFVTNSFPELAVASWNLYVNDASSPLADVRFRQAILLAIDEEESIAAYASRATTPKKMTSNTFDSIACASNCKTNKTKAAELVRAAFPNAAVPTISIDIENNDIQRSLATSAAKKLSEIGVPTTVKEHDSNDLGNAIARGEVQLFRFGWVSDVAVGGDPLVRSFKADSTENVSGVTDATLEEDITNYTTAKVFTTKKEASRTLQERLKDLWLTRPIAQFQKIVTVNKDLEGVNFDYYGRASIDTISLVKD